jgi:hypothetical protein
LKKKSAPTHKVGADFSSYLMWNTRNSILPAEHASYRHQIAEKATLILLRGCFAFDYVGHVRQRWGIC